MNTKILTIGPRYYKDNSKTGGIVVLFENWIEFCQNQNIPITIIDTTKPNYKNIIYAYLSILLQFFKNLRTHDLIFLHGTFKDYLYVAPILCLFAKLSNKKFYLRKFAGDFEARFNASSKLRKAILKKLIQKADITFWETKSLVEFGKQFNKNSIWFPNVRKQTSLPKQEFSYSKRFVFISQVKKEKGIDILLETFKELDDSFHLDIYGPLMGYTIEQLKTRNTSYLRQLKPEEVTLKLKEYDILLLPTYWEGEGYPGIIIEALSVGVPTIATLWGGIPEIVEHNYNGILIPPNNNKALVKAIKSINSTNLKKLSINASKSFEQFDAERTNNRILSYLYNSNDNKNN